MSSRNNSGKIYRFDSGLVLHYFEARVNCGMEHLQGWYFKEGEEFAFTITSRDPLIYVSDNSLCEFQRIQRVIPSWISRREFERLPYDLKRILTTKDPKNIDIL